jgi:hypothetical protein
MVNELAEIVERLYEEANELLQNDNSEDSIRVKPANLIEIQTITFLGSLLKKVFSEAITKLDDKSVSLLYNCYMGRSQAYLKTNQSKLALNDAEMAIKLKEKDSRGYLKKGY